MQRHLVTSALCLCDFCNEILSSVVNKEMTNSMSFVSYKMKLCLGAAEKRRVKSTGHFTIPGLETTATKP